MSTVSAKSLSKQFSFVDTELEPDDPEILQDMDAFKSWLNEMDAEQSAPQTSGAKPSENKDSEGTIKHCGMCKQQECI